MAVVLIVSKTQMKSGVCVGGINEDTNEFIRIHNERGGHLPFDAPYEIGDRWEMNVEKAWNARPRPHVEDMQTSAIKKINNVGHAGIISYVNTASLGKRLTQGPLQDTFEGCLQLTGKQNFINNDKVPTFSTQFWIADQDLIHLKIYENHYYVYNNIRIKFVGYQTPVELIPCGSIIRLSLANWWDGDGSNEERCYLQLSGWYVK
ncbi:dual OB domain-containing protein [Bacteroides heparinolyticus]|uniref:dual OB domain-containing protein n=1 Tax=Prevotella heparinolytica TaxID=28113 RepID=UPI003FA11C8F